MDLSKYEKVKEIRMNMEEEKEENRESIPLDNEQPQYIIINVFRQQTVRRYNRSPQLRLLPQSVQRPDNTFIQYLLMMTSLMFMFSGILVNYALMTADLKKSMASNALFIIFISIFIFLFIDYAFVCTNCSRRVPCNFYLLCLTVMTMSTIISTLSALCDTSVLLFTILSVTITVIVATSLSCTKFNFSSTNLYLVLLGAAFGAVVLVVTTVMIVNKAVVSAVWFLVLLFATFIQTTMLTIQIQTIIEGRTIKLKKDDYAIGAFMLYASVIDVFLKALQIAGVTRDIDNK